jgi:starch phosphorylase
MIGRMDRYVPLPPLPGRISRLNELAYDLWWSWSTQAREVFRDLDFPLWRFTDHNPVLLLHLIEPERLDHASSDPEFLRLYDDAIAAMDLVSAGAGTWWSSRAGGAAQPVAWVSPEFALHQSLPMDISSTGVLAGDFCREASDLGVPLVAVGLMYPRAYAHQRLSAEGWQLEHYEYIDWSDTPIGPALCPDGSRCAFTLPLAGGDVRVCVWQVRAGRVRLYLLDTDVPENLAWHRELSAKSFAEDPEGRMRQAALLGAGAVRALDALGVQPAVWHVTDGPAAVVAVERLHRMVAAGEPFDEALARVSQTTVFSTRDVAPARGDTFSFATLERHIAAGWPSLVPYREHVFALGERETDRGAAFNLSVFGARAAGSVNVPESAAATETRTTWEHLRGGQGGVGTIADGVHLSSWVAADFGRLFDAFVGDDWRERQDDPGAWHILDSVPDAEVWRARQTLRGYLIDFMRERARRRWAREQAGGHRLVALGTLLDAGTLTIGFARRFTDAARPGLVFADVERLARIVTDARRPVQIVFAGKARAGDDVGKHHLQRVFRQALDPAFGGRIAFLEDYDLHVARLLVQGCDVWLSTPRRGWPTSIGGLKAAVNGVPHLATPDAWWAGGHTGANGWVIDGGRATDPAAQDAADALELYRLLEAEIVPAFYDRDRSGVPVRWTSLVKATIASTLPRFCARRAVKAFAETVYLPGLV